MRHRIKQKQNIKINKRILSPKSWVKKEVKYRQTGEKNSEGERDGSKECAVSLIE